MVEYMNRLKQNELYEMVKGEIERLLNLIRELTKDGVQSGDLDPIVRNVISSAQRIVDAVDAAPGPKRQLFIDICVAVWEDQGKPIDLPWIPKVLEKRFVDPMIGDAIEFGSAILYDYMRSGEVL